MDTRLLRSFLAVARSGSFTDAALELGYTQSTVTGHVQKLERQLGGRLLDRLSSGVVVTDLGARLIAHAEEVLAAEDRLRALTAPSGSRPSGTVRVIAPESLCTYRLPAVIGAVRAAEPDVQIWISPGGIGDALDAVRRGTADLALTMEPRAPVTDLALEKIGTEPLILVDHGARIGDSTTWAELAGRDALLIEEGCGYSDDVANHLAATGAGPGRRSRFGSIEAIKRCVAVGLGWTALPAISAESEIRSGELRIIPGPDLPACDIHMATHPRRHPGPALEVVLAELRRTWARSRPPKRN
ncbi:LysR family transcriptional regulator [Nocardia mexicana]|uniref:DNA-binding transcriptional LysR family regulator n=1 Tax=Nocardia mexicana TaxID=279262 RepID=A0A370HA07_9NOCA|nr:LysR family transcriptional regulator [Nocardia mexicana]RDI53349.1 DNA-binding transcriptional LysR family regulator [Nocardia mexicana]